MLALADTTLLSGLPFENKVSVDDLPKKGDLSDPATFFHDAFLLKERRANLLKYCKSVMEG